MTLEETLRLIDAGFSADEIRSMAAEKVPEEKPAGAKDESANESKPAEKPKEESENNDVKSLTEEISKLNETVKALQEDNIKKASAGSSNEGSDPVMDQINSFLKEL